MFKSDFGIQILLSLCFSRLIPYACAVFYINTWAFENAAKIGIKKFSKIISNKLPSNLAVSCWDSLKIHNCIKLQLKGWETLRKTDSAEEAVVEGCGR